MYTKVKIYEYFNFCSTSYIFWDYTYILPLEQYHDYNIQFKTDANVIGGLSFNILSSYQKYIQHHG